MSITLSDNKIVITKEIEINSLLEKVDDISDQWEVGRELKRELLASIEEEAKPLIREKLNLTEKIESADWSEYKKHLDNKIDLFIEEEIQKRVDSALEKYLKRGSWGESEIDKLVRQRIEQHFTESIHPRISHIMNQMITINPIDVENELENMNRALDDAYQAGGEAALSSI